MQNQTSTAGELKGRGGRPARVLVVDDYADNVESMAMVLRLYGHEVDAALGGLAALEAAKARRPDVVLLDISMPGMDGYEVARRLRGMFRENVTLIAVTAYGLDMDRAQCFDAGFDRHFVKPADPDEVEHLIRKIASLL